MHVLSPPDQALADSPQCRSKSEDGGALRPCHHFWRHRTHTRRCTCSFSLLFAAHRSLDITYASLAKAFRQELGYHAETLSRMEELIRIRPSFAQQNEEQRIARKRMALFPHAAEVLFVAPDIWVVRNPSCPISSLSHTLSARRATRGKTLRVPWHPLPLPKDARQPQIFSSAPTPQRPPVSSTGVHNVRHTTVDSPGVLMCLIASVCRNRRLHRTLPRYRSV